MKCAFEHRVTVRCLIFLFIFFGTPTVGDASNYFYTNELGLSSKVLSTVSAGLLGEGLVDSRTHHSRPDASTDPSPDASTDPSPDCRACAGLTAVVCWGVRVLG